MVSDNGQGGREGREQGREEGRGVVSDNGQGGREGREQGREEGRGLVSDNGQGGRGERAAENIDCAASPPTITRAYTRLHASTLPRVSSLPQQT